MAINIWDIFIYIYRWKYLVAAVAVAALLFTVYSQQWQSIPA